MMRNKNDESITNLSHTFAEITAMFAKYSTSKDHRQI